MAYASQAPGPYVMKVWPMPTQAPETHEMLACCMPWRHQSKGPIKSIRPRVLYNTKWYKVVQCNIKWNNIIAGGMAYASQARKLHLMMAWDMPHISQNCMQYWHDICHASSRIACNEGIAYVSQAQKLHVTIAWSMPRTLKNCMYDCISYAHTSSRTACDEGMAHTLGASRLRANRAYKS